MDVFSRSIYVVCVMSILFYFSMFGRAVLGCWLSITNSAVERIAMAAIGALQQGIGTWQGSVSILFITHC